MNNEFKNKSLLLIFCKIHSNYANSIFELRPKAPQGKFTITFSCVETEKMLIFYLHMFKSGCVQKRERERNSKLINKELGKWDNGVYQWSSRFYLCWTFDLFLCGGENVWSRILSEKGQPPPPLSETPLWRRISNPTLKMCNFYNGNLEKGHLSEAKRPTRFE